MPHDDFYAGWPSMLGGANDRAVRVWLDNVGWDEDTVRVTLHPDDYDRLTPADRRRGYQCDACADRNGGLAW